MALAEVGRQGSANREAKQISETRSVTQTKGPQAATLFVAKYDPNWSEGATTGQTVTAATIETTADTVTFNTDGAPDTELTPIDWTTEGIAGAVQRVNKSKRWIAQFGDTAPRDAAAGAGSGQVQAAGEALLGRGTEDWYFVLSQVSTLVPVGFGVKEYYSFRKGVGGLSNLRLPDFRNTGYNYPLDPASNPSQVGRGGGISASQGEDVLPQRASKFRDFAFDAEAQKAPTTLDFATKIDTISSDLGFNLATSRDLRVINVDNVTVWRKSIEGGSGQFETPVDVVVYGPAWVRITGGVGTETQNAGDIITVNGSVRIS